MPPREDTIRMPENIQIRPYDPQEAQGWGIQAMAEPVNDKIAKVMSAVDIDYIVLFNILVGLEHWLNARIKTPNGMRIGETIYPKMTYFHELKDAIDMQSPARSGRSREQLMTVLSNMNNMFNPFGMTGGAPQPVTDPVIPKGGATPDMIERTMTEPSKEKRKMFSFRK